MSVQQHKRNFDDDEAIRTELLQLHAEIKSWRTIAALPKWSITTFGTLNRIANGAPITDPKLRTAWGLPALIPTPACHTCGRVHDYDCGSQCAIAKPGTGRKRRRAEIYPGTPPADVIRKLAEIGHVVAYVEGELEY